ncbi:unnamed protein product [Dicrocoelium dendriticum]|nr:unnamed protein product [Dicrocoelium dendriticum]
MLSNVHQSIAFHELISRTSFLNMFAHRPRLFQLLMPYHLQIFSVPEIEHQLGSCKSRQVVFLCASVCKSHLPARQLALTIAAGTSSRLQSYGFRNRIISL